MLYDTALGWLRQVLGAQAHFHDGQWEAIQAIVEQRQRVLVVQRTGWGKSLVYFLATRLLRDQGRGLTILISPLLALMRNQIEAAHRLGLRAATINSTNIDNWAEIEQAILANKIDLLLISPERLRNDRFQATIWQAIRDTIGLVAVDEAHCISDWGHDFRPDYRRIIRLLDELAPGTPILGTTATANDRVVADVAEILGDPIDILRGPLTRESLQLFVVREPLSKAERLVLLSKLMRRIQGSGIIYCATTYDCQQVADWLQQEGFNALPYFSGVENRPALEQQLLNNEVKALVASVALGMGFDKPDLHFVMHYQYPGSVISYYQQIGRAGRGIDQAKIVLMHGSEDEDIQKYFIDTAFPAPKDVERVIRALAEHAPLTPHDLQQHINAKSTTIEKILLHLELENIAIKEDEAYILTGKRSAPDFARWSQVSARRYIELAQMQAYIQHEGCLMRFLADALDDPTHAHDCGQCQNCRQQMIKSNPTPGEINAARHFLTMQRFINFAPRRRFPRGIDKSLRSSPKPPNMEGLALCYYADGGWGDEVRKGKYTDGCFSEALITAAAELLQRYWETLDEKPAWITCVPSLRHPDLLPEFVHQLADRLHLPFHQVIHKIEDRPQQKTMQNSFMQLQNLWGSLEIQTPIPAAPVLLIDDMVDSNWTFTLIGELLRRAGSGNVYPFALAKINA